MTKHTPGPWLARTKHFSNAGEGTPYVSHGDSAAVMCFLNLSGCYNGIAEIERAKADARLIAAAPDLLALAEMIIVDVECYCDENTAAGLQSPCAHHAAKAAIAKASEQ